MAATKPPSGKKYFTAAEANATLPLVRAIVRDVTELARDLRERHERLSRVLSGKRSGLSEAHQEELHQAQREVERGQDRMREYERELQQLGVELKDYFTGLIDFPVPDGRPRGLPVLAAGRAGSRPLARAGRGLRGPAEADDADGEPLKVV